MHLNCAGARCGKLIAGARPQAQTGAGEGPMLLTGTPQPDGLIGTAGGDFIYGFEGDDTLKGGGGADLLSGGAGFDTVDYTDSTVGVGVNLVTGHGSGGTAEGDPYFSIENVTGSLYNDSIAGDDGPNALAGLDGNDLLKGGGGNDHLLGGSGDDVLKGGGGADNLDGGGGNDTVDYSQAPAIDGVWGVAVDLLNN